MARRRIEVEIIGDYSSLQKTFTGASRGAKHFESDLGKSARGAVAASVSFRGLGRSIAFASSYFLGGAGIVYGIRSTIAAAEESQRVLGQTQVALRKSGLSWDQYGEEIKKAALEQANLSGFDDERLLGTFALFVRRTNDVNRALQLNALAADVARGRNISLERASLLVLKASLGQAGALRRVGIEAQKGATGLQLVDMLSKKYSGSAAAYGQTAAGAQDRFRVAVQNLQEAIGAGLLPEITNLLNPLSAWLNDSKNQERVQHDVTQAAQDFAAVARDLKAVIDGVDKVTGSFGNTLKLLGEIFVALKLRQWALEMGLFAAAEREASASAVVSRISAYTSAVEATGTAAAVSKGQVAGLATALTGLGALTVAPILIPIEIKFGHKERALLDKLGKLGAVPKVLLDVATAGGAVTGGDVISDAASVVKGKKSEPVDTTLSATNGLGPHHSTRTDSPSTTTDTKRGGKRALSLQGQLNLAELALAEASATKSVKDDLVALKRKAAILRALIAKGGTLAQQTQRNQDLGSTLDQINTINEAATKATKAAVKEKAKKKQPTKKVKAPEFALPFALQLAELKAQTTKTDVDDIRVAKAEKAFAEKLIKSGKLRGQALLDAWQAIIDANNRIADQQTAQTRQVAATSTRLLTAGLGLTAAQRQSLEQRFAQAEAHPGQKPGEVAANGIVINGDLNLHGVTDVRSLANKLTKEAKRNSGQTRGMRGGSYLGHH